MMLCVHTKVLLHVWSYDFYDMNLTLNNSVIKKNCHGPSFEQPQ